MTWSSRVDEALAAYRAQPAFTLEARRALLDAVDVVSLRAGELLALQPDRSSESALLAVRDDMARARNVMPPATVGGAGAGLDDGGQVATIVATVQARRSVIDQIEGTLGVTPSDTNILTTHEAAESAKRAKGSWLPWVFGGAVVGAIVIAAASKR